MRVGAFLIPDSLHPQPSLKGLVKAASLEASCVSGNNVSLFWHSKEGPALPLWMPLWEGT